MPRKGAAHFLNKSAKHIFSLHIAFQPMPQCHSDPLNMQAPRTMHLRNA